MWIFQRWKPCNIVKKIKKKKRTKILIESDRKGKNLILLAILNIDAFCLNKISKLLCNFHKIFEYIIFCWIKDQAVVMQQKIIYSKILWKLHNNLEILFKQKIAEFYLKYSLELFQNGKKNKICIFWYIGVFEINIYFKLFNKKLLIYWRTYKYLINIKDFFIFYFIILQIF